LRLYFSFPSNFYQWFILISVVWTLASAAPLRSFVAIFCYIWYFLSFLERPLNWFEKYTNFFTLLSVFLSLINAVYLEKSWILIVVYFKCLDPSNRFSFDNGRFEEEDAGFIHKFPGFLPCINRFPLWSLNPLVQYFSLHILHLLYFGQSRFDFWILFIIEPFLDFFDLISAPAFLFTIFKLLTILASTSSSHSAGLTKSV